MTRHSSENALVTAWPAAAVNCTQQAQSQSQTNEQHDSAWISDEVRSAYKVFHGWFATVWCALTSISNVVTIIVLQHKAMRNTTNTLLTGVAAMHLIISLLYIPLAQILLTFQLTQSDSGSYLTAHFLLIIVISIITAQMCSIWMTVSVALFRFICIRFPQHSAQLCTVRTASHTVACVIFVCQLLSIPAWLAHYVNEVQTDGPAPAPAPAPAQSVCHDNANANATSPLQPSTQAPNSTIKSGYTVSLRSGTVTTASIWINSLCGKFVPSLILCILSILLVRTMKLVDKRRQRLVGKDRTTTTEHSDEHRPEKEKASERSKTPVEKDDRERKTNRTTQLLIAVAVMFILSNLPQSALELTAAFNSYFRGSVYPIIGDLMDTVAQLNNGITFVIYCTMSELFRRTFRSIFVRPVARRLCLGSRTARKQTQTERTRPSSENKLLPKNARSGTNTDVTLSILADHGETHHLVR